MLLCQDIFQISEQAYRLGRARNYTHSIGLDYELPARLGKETSLMVQQGLHLRSQIRLPCTLPHPLVKLCHVLAVPKRRLFFGTSTWALQVGTQLSKIGMQVVASPAVPP